MPMSNTGADYGRILSDFILSLRLPVENFKYLGVILNADNNHRTHLQETIKNANKTYFMLQNFFKNKNIFKKLKLILKNTIIDKTLTYALETSTLTKRERKQLNIFERKVYRRILGPVYDNGKENWRILTNEEIYANIKKTYYNRDNKAA